MTLQSIMNEMYGYCKCTQTTYKGQPDGNVGRKVVQLPPWPSSTPLSPEEKKMDVPRAPSWAYALQMLLQSPISIWMFTRLDYSSLGQARVDEFFGKTEARGEH